jgi:hypothetical protein
MEIARAQLSHGYIDDGIHTIDHAMRADDQYRAGEAAAERLWAAGSPDAVAMRDPRFTTAGES